MKAGEIQNSTKAILMWGKPGCGKTVLTGTLGPILHLINLDGNIDSLKTTRDAFSEQRKLVEVELGLEKDDVLPTGAIQYYAIDKLRNYFYAVGQWCLQEKYPFKAVALDHLTRVAVMARRKIMATVIHPKNEHPHTPDIGQWGMIFTEIEMVINAFVAIPRMKVLIAHEATNETDMAISHEIMIPGRQLPAIIRSMFSEIWYLENRTQPQMDGTTRNNYLIRTVQSLNGTARSCLNIPDGTSQSLGMVEILRRQGVEI
jgi:hypothetical protein